jgi:hypothetical protein
MSSILIHTFKFKIAMDFIKLLTAIKIQISLWETKSIKSREINQIETLLLLYPERAFRELMNLKDSLFINFRPILIFKLQI